MNKRIKKKKEKELLYFTLFDPKPKNWKHFKEACREMQSSDDWLRFQFSDDYHAITGSKELDAWLDEEFG